MADQETQAGGPAGAGAESFVYADIPVEAAVHSAQRATPDEIVQLGKKIWAEVGSSGVAKGDSKGNDELLERLQEKYKNFTTSFPIVLRWMVQMRQFSAAALRKYLLKHASVKLDTREAFLELQADYIVLLYRELNRHPDEAFMKKYRASIVKQLIDEDKEFIETQKQVEKDFAQREVVLDQERRQRLFEYLTALKKASQ
jgi:hypothetical protein